MAKKGGVDFPAILVVTILIVVIIAGFFIYFTRAAGEKIENIVPSLLAFISSAVSSLQNPLAR